MRETLKKYYGKRVRVQGTYVGRPKKHEKTGREFDKENNEYPSYRKGTILPDEVEESSLSYTSPISFPEHASCIIDVRGIEGYDIAEDHINVQEDIGELWCLAKNESIELEGLVGKYNKSDGEDYCLVEVQRILR